MGVIAKWLCRAFGHAWRAATSTEYATLFDEGYVPSIGDLARARQWPMVCARGCDVVELGTYERRFAGDA